MQLTAIEMLLSGAVSALCGTVGYLFVSFQNEFKDVKQRLKDCEDDRKKLWERVADGWFRGHQEGTTE
jgi:hypothetical protein